MKKLPSPPPAFCAALCVRLFAIPIVRLASLSALALLAAAAKPSAEGEMTEKREKRPLENGALVVRRGFANLVARSSAQILLGVLPCQGAPAAQGG